MRVQAAASSLLVFNACGFPCMKHCLCWCLAFCGAGGSRIIFPSPAPAADYLLAGSCHEVASPCRVWTAAVPTSHRRIVASYRTTPYEGGKGSLSACVGPETEVSTHLDKRLSPSPSGTIPQPDAAASPCASRDEEKQGRRAAVRVEAEEGVDPQRYSTELDVQGLFSVRRKGGKERNGIKAERAQTCLPTRTVRLARLVEV